MKNSIILFFCALLIFPGCAGRPPKLPPLSEGISQQQVLSLWGEPRAWLIIGKTPRNDYPVDVWAYYGKPQGKKPRDEHLLIFVNGELYKTAANNPELIVQELDLLGVLTEGIEQLITQLGTVEDQRLLRESAAQAEQTRRNLEVIRTFQDYENTRRQIETSNHMRMLQQQQLRPVTPPPPAAPPSSTPDRSVNRP